MNNYIISLFNSKNWKKTIILFTIAAILITISLIIGISDNFPMILIFFTGCIFFLFSILHCWKKTKYFAIFAGICFALLIIDFIFPFINEGIAMTFGFVCFIGTIAGIIGVFTRIKSWNRLPVAGALLSIVALGILTVTVTGLPMKHILTKGTEWILISLHILVSIILLVTGIINKKESLSTKVILLTSGTIFVLYCFWGVYASTWQFEENSKGFTSLMLRIFAFFEIFIAFITIYAIISRSKNS